LPLFVQGEKNDMGDLTLTNDRILFVSNKLGHSGNIIGDLIGGALEGKQGKHEITRLADLRAGRMQNRRVVPDLWDATIRRLLTQRHGAAVTEDGDAWRAEPR
jgi:hypothetical protein